MQPLELARNLGFEVATEQTTITGHELVELVAPITTPQRPHSSDAVQGE
jgi:hypothetical protein